MTDQYGWPMHRTHPMPPRWLNSHMSGWIIRIWEYRNGEWDWRGYSLIEPTREIYLALLYD